MNLSSFFILGVLLNVNSNYSLLGLTFYLKCTRIWKICKWTDRLYTPLKVRVTHFINTIKEPMCGTRGFIKPATVQQM